MTDQTPKKTSAIQEPQTRVALRNATRRQIKVFAIGALLVYLPDVLVLKLDLPAPVAAFLVTLMGVGLVMSVWAMSSYVAASGRRHVLSNNSWLPDRARGAEIALLGLPLWYVLVFEGGVEKTQVRIVRPRRSATKAFADFEGDLWTCGRDKRILVVSPVGGGAPLRAKRVRTHRFRNLARTLVSRAGGR